MRLCVALSLREVNGFKSGPVGPPVGSSCRLSNLHNLSRTMKNNHKQDKDDGFVREVSWGNELVICVVPVAPHCLDTSLRLDLRIEARFIGVFGGLATDLIVPHGDILRHSPNLARASRYSFSFSMQF